MYVILKSILSDKAPKNSYGFVIAGYYAAIDIAFSRISGGSMNPARVLGPAIFCGHFWNLWIYLVGPCVGSILGTFFYRAVHMETNKRLAETTQQTNLVMLKPIPIESRL